MCAWTDRKLPAFKKTSGQPERDKRSVYVGVKSEYCILELGAYSCRGISCEMIEMISTGLH